MEPLEICIAGNGRALKIRWDDGTTASLDAALLWRHCRSAAAVRQAVDGRVRMPPENLSIGAVRPVGIYAVNIAFSDGNDRGIYPWPLLADLAKGIETV